MSRVRVFAFILLTVCAIFNVGATTYYVNASRPNDSGVGTSWATAKKTIQAAITVSAAGDSIIVTNGLYAPISTSNKSITIRSVNGAKATLIDGGSTTRCATLGSSSTHTNTVLTGFTLQNGKTFDPGGGSYGGTLNNCTLSDNMAGTYDGDTSLGDNPSYGGGSYGGTLNNCTLSGNTAFRGGGSSHSTLNNCTLVGNEGYWGGGASDGILNNCTLRGNLGFWGGGSHSGMLNNCILCGNRAVEGGGCSSHAKLNNCILSGNTAEAGGGSSDSTLNNCTLIGNTAYMEGGGSIWGTLNNCTLSGNATEYGGGSYGSTLSNCIIWGNRASESGNNCYEAEVRYSCSDRLESGAGNIAANPMFVDAENGDFRLRLGSPCIDRGLDSYAVGAFDLAGSARIQDAQVDMGAYEYCSGTLGDAVNAPFFSWKTGGNANWFSQTATTHDTVDAAQSGDVNNSQASWMQTTLTGPGTLSFWWKVSSESGCDYLRFYIDSSEQSGSISGNVDWQQKMFSIPSGSHTVKWAYTKDGSVSSGSDCGWVDQVSWAPASGVTRVHRFWSDQFGSHFYIMGDSERDRIAAKYPGIWKYEAVAWYAYPEQKLGTEPVHRFWSDRLGKHFYIMGDSERDRIAAKYQGIWRYEAVAWYAYPNQVSGTEPVGRFWSDRFMGHFYIITQSEINRIAAKYPGIWNYEAVAYYAYPTLPRGMSAQMPDQAKAFAGNTDDGLVNNKNNKATADSEIISDVSAHIDVVYPLTVSEGQVTAYVYDSTTEQWKCVLPATDTPAAVVLENVQPDRSYLLDVLAGDSDGEMTSVHQSSFLYQLDPPETIHENSDAVAQDDSGSVGNPIARIKMPSVEGTLTLKLYSSSQGVVKTLTDVVSGETVELSIPEWNRWFWVGGWRDTDEALVLSLWLRQEAEE